MAYRKILIWEDGLEFLNKILSNRYNYGYEFKCFFLREIWTDLYMKGCQSVCQLSYIFRLMSC